MVNIFIVTKKSTPTLTYLLGSNADEGEAPATQDEEMSTDQQEENSTNPQALGSVYSQFLHFYQHLLPVLQRYEYMLNHPDDANYRTANDDHLPDQIAEIFHDLSHAFHSLSDISFNFASPEPRRLMCYPQMSPVRFPPPGVPHIHMPAAAAAATAVPNAAASSTSQSSGN